MPAPMSGSRWIDGKTWAALAIAACAAVAPSGLRGLGLDEPLRPFFAQAPGQTVLLGLRGLILFAAIVCVAPRGRAQVLALLLAVSLFVASLCAQGLLVVDVVVMLPLLAWLARGGPPPEGSRSVTLAALLFSALALLSLVPTSSPPGPGDDPHAAVEYWRGRKNLFRARAVAFDWAMSEEPPAEGYVALAAIDWDLGQPERARKVLGKVLARATSDDVRRRASELDRRWSTGAP
jgi:hypothetical protein